MSKFQLTFAMLLVVVFSYSQNKWGFETTLGIAPTNGKDYTGYSTNILMAGGLISYQKDQSYWSFHSGLEYNHPYNLPSFLRIPLKVNFYPNQQNNLFIGAGMSYNYLISSFTNVPYNNLDLLFEAGYKISLGPHFSLIPRINYSFGLQAVEQGNTEYRYNVFMLSIGLRYDLLK